MHFISLVKTPSFASLLLLVLSLSSIVQTQTVTGIQIIATLNQLAHQYEDLTLIAFLGDMRGHRNSQVTSQHVAFHRTFLWLPYLHSRCLPLLHVQSLQPHLIAARPLTFQ